MSTRASLFRHETPEGQKVHIFEEEGDYWLEVSSYGASITIPCPAPLLEELGWEAV